MSNFSLKAQTNISSEGTDSLMFFNNGSKSLNIDPFGKVRVGGIGNTSPTAIFEINSTSGGFLTPRMTTIQRDAIASPAIGLLVYNTTVNRFQAYDGSAWITIFTDEDNTAWSLSGNSGTTAGTDFLGTTDATDLVFKTNGVARAGISANGRVGVGTSTPVQLLDVNGQINIPPDSSYRIGNIQALSIAGLRNTYVGNAGNSGITGTSNTLLGDQAGQMLTTGTSNTFLGVYAGQETTTGGSNVFVGYEAGRYDTTGSANAFVGVGAGRNTNAAGNTFMGHLTGASNEAGAYNTFMGYSAGRMNTNPTGSIVIGRYAGYSSNGGSYNNIQGYNAGYNNMGSYNVFLGGYLTGYNNTGAGNIFVGGYYIGFNNLSGSQNTFIGGYYTGYSNTGGNYNTFLGSYAGRYSDAHNNTYVGYYSGNGTTTGGNNTALGRGAGDFNSTGSSNTFIGYNSDATLNNLTNATAIGANASVSQSNSLILGNAVNVGIGTSSPVTDLHLEAGTLRVANGAATMDFLQSGTQSVLEASNTFAIAANGGATGFSMDDGDATFYLGTHVLGSFQIQDGTQAAGNILVSDASGNASWSTPASQSLVSGSGTSNYVPKWTSSSSLGNSLVYDNGTNVGIGITNPERKLHVDGGFDGMIRIMRQGISSGFYAGIEMGTYNGSGDEPKSAIYHYDNYSYGRGDMYFAIDYTADYTTTVDPTDVKMMIQGSTGNIGIGTTSPASTLDIGTGTFTWDGGSGQLQSSVDAIKWNRGWFNILIDANNTHTNAHFALWNNISAYTGSPVVQFHMDNGSSWVNHSGNFGVGTTSPGQKLDVGGNVYASGGDFYASASNGVINCGGGIMNANANVIADATPTINYATGDEDLYIADDLEVNSVAYKPGGGSWATISDSRLKKDITPYSDGLTQILQIEPVRFRYNNKVDVFDKEKEHVGVIAQDMLQIAPYMVDDKPIGQEAVEDENGVERIVRQGEEYYSFDPSALNYMLINAVKELKQQIDAQNQLILELQEEVNRLKAK